MTAQVKIRQDQSGTCSTLSVNRERVLRTILRRQAEDIFSKFDKLNKGFFSCSDAEDWSLSQAHSNSKDLLYVTYPTDVVYAACAAHSQQAALFRGTHEVAQQCLTWHIVRF